MFRTRLLTHLAGLMLLLTVCSGCTAPAQMRWSPDGRKLLFTSDRGGGDNLWTMDADGAGKTATVQGTAAQGAFQSTSMEIASAKGTRWTEPDVRDWEGDSGTLHKVHWAG